MPTLAKAHTCQGNILIIHQTKGIVKGVLSPLPQTLGKELDSG